MAQRLWDLLLLKDVDQLLLYLRGVGVNGLDVQSDLAVHRNLLQQLQAQVHLGNGHLLGVRGHRVESEEEEEEPEDGVFPADCKGGDEVDHFLVDFVVVDGPIDQIEGLEEGVDEVALEDALVVGIVGLGEGHHEYLVNVLDVLVVDGLLEDGLLVDDQVLHIAGHELDLVPHAGELVVVLEDRDLFLELLVGFVVA